MLSGHRRDPENAKAIIHKALKREYPDSLSISQLAALGGKNTKSVDGILRKLMDEGKAEKVSQGTYIWKSDDNELKRERNSVRSRVLDSLMREYPGALTSIQLQERLNEPQNRIMNATRGLITEGIITNIRRGVYQYAQDGIR